MILDQQLTMSNRQQLLATAYSIDTIDIGQARPSGDDMLSLYAHIQAESGTNPTLTIELESSADNSTFTKVGSVVKSAGKREMAMRLERVPFNRYLRLRYVLGGTSPTYTVTAGLVTGVQDWTARADSAHQA